MWSDELIPVWTLCLDYVVIFRDQIILEHFPDVVFFMKLGAPWRCSTWYVTGLEPLCTWIGTSVNHLICTHSFPNSGLHHFKWRCDHTISGRRTEAWLCCFSCIQHSVQWINSHIMIPIDLRAKCQINTGCDIHLKAMFLCIIEVSYVLFHD